MSHDDSPTEGDEGGSTIPVVDRSEETVTGTWRDHIDLPTDPLPSRSERAKFRLLDSDGKPVSGVPMNITVTSVEGETETIKATPGPTGFTTVDLSGVDLNTAESVTFTPTTGGQQTTVDPSSLLGNGSNALNLGFERGMLDIPDSVFDGFDEQVFPLPPDIDDLLTAPELFNPKVVEENGTCSIDFTAKVDVHENFFNQLVRLKPESLEETAVDRPSGENVLDGQIPFELSPAFPPDRAELPEEERSYLHHASTPTFGTLNVYKQSWTRVGHSLGKLLHSLTLAPCESTEVAIVEWSRTERGRRQERTGVSEQKRHELHRNRMIEEIVEGMVKEKQWGKSRSVQGGVGVSGGLAGVAQGVLGSVGLSIGGGAAASASQTGGRRQLQASTVHNLVDNVVQGASSMRSLRSTVVTQSQEVERDEVRTRSVENHNRNHALTVEYFQVLEHYNVHTDFERETEVLMIPYEIPVALWNDPPAFSAFVIDETERISLLATVATRVGNRMDSFLSQSGQDEIGDTQLVNERQTAINEIQEAVLTAGRDLIDEESDIYIVEDDPVKFATKAWADLRRRIQGDENVLFGNYNIKAEHFDRGAFFETVLEATAAVMDRTDPREESPLVGWLDQHAESLREMVPAEYDDAFDALYRLVHTPEVYEASKPTVTISNWTVELREAWRPGVSILVHTTNGQTVSLRHDEATEGSAVASFSSPPVDAGAISAFEINFAPEKATKTVVKSVGETVDDLGDALGEVGEFFTGQDDAPLTEEVKKARKYDVDRFRVTGHTDPMESLPQSQSYQLLDESNVDETLTADDTSLRRSNVHVREPDILETETRRYEDYSKVEELINHVQANRMAYLRRLWLNEDPDKRALRFQPYRYPIRQNGSTELVPLLDLIENEPLGVVGNSVAFRLLDQDQLENYEEVTDDDLRSSKLVSLPTRGVYAETLLSHCNATEMRDLDRMPTERSRCQTEAPDITGVSPGSRQSDEQLQPTVPQSTVSLQQPPSAPQPTGLSQALQLLATPDIFRDMSLGSETVDAANTLAKQALTESGDARKQTLEALSSMLGGASGDGGSGSSGSGGASSSDGGGGSGGGGGGSQSAAFEAARDAVQNAANEAYRKADPVRVRDLQRAQNKARDEGSYSEEDHERSTKRLHNADETKSPASGRDFPTVKQFDVEHGDQWVKGKVLLADFDVGSSSLKQQHKSFLRDQLMPVLEDGKIPLIEGHASRTGPADENQQLSEDRAKAVRDFLVEELGLPAHRILDVTGVGESEPVDAGGPIEDPAERSVVLQYRAYTPVPVIDRPETPVDPEGQKKYTKWRMRLDFEPKNTLEELVSGEGLIEQALKQKTIDVILENREEENPQTLKGKILFRGIHVGIWLNTPPEGPTSTDWLDFETDGPMAEMAWHGVMGDIQFGVATTNEYTSGVHAVVLDLAPMKSTIKTKVRLTKDDEAIGVQGGSSLLTPLDAQLWLTDPKPTQRPGADTTWEWEWSP
ncbi:hypothetical protein C2R22_13635 [Salinigranum rubrum]|uniref:OmpA-like domain-containing protein n=1 Tax=Salinigranum rubrum TaxID=755307 RepID=A0A2I8VKU4_9EURY|nr:OmpA family protein [Salinigranum rubrum]AUV82550.1 hypothetical protein C2R22_13635 [Salinigranum rubrum]